MRYRARHDLWPTSHRLRGAAVGAKTGRIEIGTAVIDMRYDAVPPLEETVRALDTLIQQGKVRYIGCSNWQAWKIAKALGISELKNLARFDTLQAYYSIAGRDIEREIVPLLESEKVGLLVWSPLAGGLLSGKFSRTNQKPADSRRTDYDFPLVDKERAWKILDLVAPIAKAHGCSPARVSLAWLLATPRPASG
jgi:aryl-alcohol dehydrogenase-like predicted oxidoreductase